MSLFTEKTVKDCAIRYYHLGREPNHVQVKKEIVRKRAPDEFDVVSGSKTSMLFFMAKVSVLPCEVIKRADSVEWRKWPNYSEGKR